MSEQQSDLRRRALGAILANALRSPQFLFTIAFTLALYVFVGDNISVPLFDWQSWYWLVGGGLAGLGFLAASVTDPEAAQEAVNRMFEQKLQLDRVKNRVARQHIQKALEYRKQMLDLAKKAKGSLKTNLLQTVDDVNAWIDHMVNLGLHLDEFAENQLIVRDLKEVPTRISKVSQRIEIEKRNGADLVVAELQKQREQLEQQLTNLQAAVNNSKRAEIQLESALASLGTIYAQMSRLDTSEVDSGRMQRMRLEIQEEVNSLQDTIHAMEEVQQQALRLG